MYDGRQLIGSIAERDRQFLVVLPDGVFLGIFSTLKAATAAISTAHGGAPMSAPQSRWQAGVQTKHVGDGLELAAIVLAQRAAKPWLYEDLGPSAAAGGEPHHVHMVPVGVPIAIKIGVAIGQARRRDHPRQLPGPRQSSKTTVLS